MFQQIRDKNIWRVYFATLSLGGAYGMALSLIAIHLDSRGFGKADIGTLAAWFAGGIIALSLPAGTLIRRFGAKTVLVASLVGYAATVASFPFLQTYAQVAAVRFVDGACSVSIWVGCETILLARSDEDHKAYVTSFYAVAMAVGYIVGPIGARIIAGSASLSAAFVIAGVIAVATALYVAVRLDAGGDGGERGGEGSSPTASDRSAWSVLWRVKTSCFATFTYGYFQASVVLFLPLYLITEKGIARDQTILVPAFFAAGMLLFANPAGRLGDRFGHLLLMRVLAVVGMTMVLGFVYLEAWVAMCVAVFVAGATLASISPVSLALQGHVVEPSEYSRATAIYNAFYAGGMLVGPPVSSMFFEKHRGAAMLYHLALLLAAFIVFSQTFHRDDPAVVDGVPHQG